MFEKTHVCTWNISDRFLTFHSGLLQGLGWLAWDCDAGFVGAGVSVLAFGRRGRRGGLGCFLGGAHALPLVALVVGDGTVPLRVVAPPVPEALHLLSADFLVLPVEFCGVRRTVEAPRGAGAVETAQLASLLHAHREGRYTHISHWDTHVYSLRGVVGLWKFVLANWPRRVLATPHSCASSSRQAGKRTTRRASPPPCGRARNQPTLRPIDDGRPCDGQSECCYRATQR